MYIDVEKLYKTFWRYQIHLKISGTEIYADGETKKIEEFPTNDEIFRELNNTELGNEFINFIDSNNYKIIIDNTSWKYVKI